MGRRNRDPFRCGSTYWDRYRLDPSLGWQIQHTRRGALLHNFPWGLLTPETRLLVVIYASYPLTLRGRDRDVCRVPSYILAMIRADLHGLDGH